ncbi:putative ABC transporter ATP-binding protein [Actinacidiphila reveromycinica]|uniref:Putative ABC transporter ATP-binding protein n=1 Tax=Actinacidiphila reveromycinica TaxID=659352 RepID=A0A7U3UWK0_9ACTN|nr:ABC transporter ATP-binding protein [Streptomyces sp. SN-593]BBB00118.1 putative ABC transporter ATP-binding protein [Streptomyces sp. SN-593]
MIRQLLAIVPPRERTLLRTVLALQTGGAVLQGVAFVLLVPALRALLGSDPGSAWPWIWSLAGVAAAQSVVYYLGAKKGFEAGASLSRVLHHRIGDHTAELPLGWFGPARTGELSTLTTQTVMAIMRVPGYLLRPLVNGLLTPAVVVALMYAFDWRLALAATATVPVIMAVYRWTTGLTEKADTIRAKAMTDAAGRVIEYAEVQPVLRSFGRSGQGGSRALDAALDAQRDASHQVVRAGVPGLLGFTLVVQAAFTTVLVYGTYLALGGSLAVPELMALLVLAARFVEPMTEAANLGSALRSARGALAAVQEVLDVPPMPQPDHPVVPAGSSIEFDRVSFRYGTGTVLDEASFRVPERTMTALVGPSGSGKTTVTRLIARFWEVDSGAVRIGGTDVRDVTTEELMARISVVFQDVYLFEGTIEENIRIGRPDATAEEVRAAAAKARVDDIVRRLPDGWDAQVGEGGATLSGGERQRISIARAILKDAPIVLLDEATASLDPENERAVQEALTALTADRTLLVIAHRLQTVMAADQILVLDGGRIVQRGTHDQLIVREGRYADFWAQRNRAQGWRLGAMPAATDAGAAASYDPVGG